VLTCTDTLLYYPSADECSTWAFTAPEDGGQWGVSWAEVAGVIALDEVEYTRRAGEKNTRMERPGATHEEMVELGWQSQWYPAVLPDLHPILIGGNASDEFPVRIDHERGLACSASYSTIVRCTWPPEEDKANAIRIGQELVDNDGNALNWEVLASKEDIGDYEGVLKEARYDAYQREEAEFIQLARDSGKKLSPAWLDARRREFKEGRPIQWIGEEQPHD
jgi:hypothetical protein